MPKPNRNNFEIFADRSILGMGITFLIGCAGLGVWTAVAIVREYPWVSLLLLLPILFYFVGGLFEESIDKSI